MTGPNTLISASEISLVYQPAAAKLYLNASGKKQPNTENIHFERAKSVGAIKFNLVGDVYPIEGDPIEYSIQNIEQPIILKSPANPLGVVIIADAEHPDGVPVEVKWLGLNPPPDSKTASSPTPSSTAQTLVSPDPSNTVLPPDNKIFTVVGHDFQIRTQAYSEHTGGSTIKFDSSYLKLTSAGNEFGEIVWFFSALKLGVSQVIVTTNLPAPAILTLQKTYHITAGLLDPSTNTVKLQSPPVTDSKDNIVTPTYKLRVSAAIAMVTKSHPSAQLYQVNATPYLAGSSARSGWELTTLTALFRTGEEGDAPSLSTTSHQGLDWEAPIPLGPLPIGIGAIDFEAEVVYGLEEVIAKFPGLYLNASLTKPMGTPPQHPVYRILYHAQKQDEAVVDATTGEVLSGWLAEEGGAAVSSSS